MKKVRLSGQAKKILRYRILLLLILIFFNIFIYTVDDSAGAFMTLGIICYVIALLIYFWLMRASMLENLITFATEFGQVEKNVFKNLSVPYALTDERGRLLWNNNYFAQMTGKDATSYHRPVSTILQDVTIDRFPAKNEEINYEYEYNGRYYELKITNIVLDELIDTSGIVERETEESQYIYSLMFFDKTDVHEYQEKYKNERTICGLMIIDNYDEVMDNNEDIKASLLTALLDHKINTYFQSIDGIVQKYDKDKYLLVVKYKELPKLEEAHFDLLEQIKTIHSGTEILNFTMSIGIGAGQENYGENMRMAHKALDVALGRGGDQAVVREGESVRYYGGKSQAVEKSTRVKARIKSQALQEFIESKPKVVIMGHRNLDIDSFGAAIGIHRMVRSFEKPAYIVIDTETSSTKPFIDAFRNNADYDKKMFVTVHEAKEIVDPNTLLVVVDTNSPKYVCVPELLRQTKTIVVLDHHRQGNEIIRDPGLSYIQPSASSTCEMVVDLFQFGSGFKLNPLEADTLYAGMMIDTDNFMNKAGVRTFEAAAYLRRCGADVIHVRKMFREDFANLRAIGSTMESAELYRKRFLISVCPSDEVASPQIVASEAANRMLDIREAQATFVLTKLRNEINISARSINDVNVQIIMERLGGGGHLNMAGAQLKGVTIDEAERQLKRVLDEMDMNGDI
ncbi:MAG: DHH family phosphoesterase [Eubacteriales bacterium]